MGEDEEGDIVLASSTGRFPVNHEHTLTKISGDKGKLATHLPLTSRVPRVARGVKERVRLEALGLTGRVEADRRGKKGKVGGGGGGVAVGEEEKEQAVQLSATYDAMKAVTPLPTPPSHATAADSAPPARGSDCLTLRVTAHVLPVDVLETQVRLAHRAARAGGRGGGEKKGEEEGEEEEEEERVVEEWSRQQRWPPGTVRSVGEDEGEGLKGMQGVGAVVRAALWGSVVERALGELLPKRGPRLDDLRRGIQAQEEGEEEGEELVWEKLGVTAEEEEERRWRQRMEQEERVLQELQAAVGGPTQEAAMR